VFFRTKDRKQALHASPDATFELHQVFQRKATKAEILYLLIHRPDNMSMANIRQPHRSMLLEN